MGFIHTVRAIENLDVLSSRKFEDKFPEKHSREWTKQSLITYEEATEA